MANKAISLLLILILGLMSGVSYKLLNNKKEQVVSKTYIKVFFGDNFIDEKSYIQPFNNWFKGYKDGKFTLEELYNDGWKLINVIKTNANASEWQISFFMEINEDDYNLVKSKYENKEIKINANVPLKEGL